MYNVSSYHTYRILFAVSNTLRSFQYTIIHTTYCTILYCTVPCRYHLPIYITENGLAWEELNSEVAVDDVQRQQYLYDHIEAVGQAIVDGCDVRGYFVW